MRERLRFIFYDSEASRRNAMNISHHASNTFIRKVTLQAQNAHLASVKTLSSKYVLLASHASLKFKQQEWPDLGLEDVERQGVDLKAAEYLHWRSVGK